MRKVLHIISRIFTWFMVVFSISMMILTIVSVTTFDRNDRKLLGYQALIVRSDSMSATDFNAGDLIFIKETDPSSLKIGDIIAYQSEDTNNYGETITHKIGDVTTDADGNASFITYGTTTGIEDEYYVSQNQVQGQYIGKLPNVGSFFQFLKTVPGYLICILLPFMVLIMIQAFNTFRIFKQYKKEQIAALDAEKEQISIERAEAQRMLDEVRLLRAELGLSEEETASENEPFELEQKN